jgi:hypothetical protein
MRATKPRSSIREHKSPLEPSDIFRCPVTRRLLRFAGDIATTDDGSHSYAIIAGLPVLVPEGEIRRLAESALKARHEDAAANRNAVVEPAQ